MAQKTPKSRSKDASVQAVLRRLIAICRAEEAGFRAASDVATDPDIQSLCIRCAEERSEFLHELQEELTGYADAVTDENPQQAAWLDLESAVRGGDDATVVAQCEREEEEAVEAFREAATNSSLGTMLKAIIAAQVDRVSAAHEEFVALQRIHRNA
jgi:uncharacterized protein (TIGR02284 family)